MKNHIVKIKPFLIRWLNRFKLLIAILLDLVDLILGNIPILNSIWDFVTLVVLLFILKDPKLALMSSTEFLLPGIPPFGQIDALIPMATILTLIDIGKNNVVIMNFSNVENGKTKSHQKSKRKIINPKK